MKTKIFEQCQKLFPEWAALSMADFTFDDPKGFSSFTMGIRSNKAVQPTAVLYRRLEGKENAIFDNGSDIIELTGVINRGGAGDEFKVSPDETLVAYLIEEDNGRINLVVVPVGGGTETRIPQSFLNCM
jgi:hypothetical protein